MPRPKSKQELLDLSRKNFNKLNDFIDALDPTERDLEFPPGTMNRNIRDVLAHLHDWHLMMLEWYKIGMSGEKPEMPAPGYTWKTTPELNRAIWEKNLSLDLETCKGRFARLLQCGDCTHKATFG